MKSLQPAHKRRTVNEESQLRIFCRRNANARGSCDRMVAGVRGIFVCDPQPSRTTHVPPVEPPIHVQCFAQTSGAATQLKHPVRAASALHERKSCQRLDRPNEHRRRLSPALRHCIHAVTRVDRVDVSIPRRPEHRGISLGLTTKGMRR